MSFPIRLVIADDHELILDGLQTLLKNDPNLEIVGVAKDGDMLLELADRYSPDVALVDIKMPVLNGIEATKWIIRKNPDIKVVAFSFMDNEYAIIDMLEAGALGYVVKSSSKEEIITAIKTVNEGVPYYCEYTSPVLKRLIAQSRFDPYKNKGLDILDQREKEIIRRICEEKTNQEIADELFLSIRTVEWYRLNLAKKLQVRSLVGLVIYAMKTGLVEL